MKNHINRLSTEKSPYLLQHADNPVQWYPWGEAAFDRAAAEDKPIILSSGYSTCHWCHVMAAESFSDPRTAEIMNRAFVSVKLDREERPDIDHLYITAVSALNGSAGWPLNVFLTPEGKPFFGGTYFPHQPRLGMLSWQDVLLKIEAMWQDPEGRQKIISAADAITEALKKQMTGPSGPAEAPAGTTGQKLIHDALQGFSDSFDSRNGGFSRSPKFPVPPVLRFLLAAGNTGFDGLLNKDDQKAARDMALATLSAMAQGGIFDHVGGGFHRYATDQHWHLPHFEKMLYDNAQLAEAYLEAYTLTGERYLATAAAQTLDYLLRDLRHPDGGFYAAEDADSRPPEETAAPKKEGAFYTWRLAEIKDLLTPEAAEIIAWHYGLAAGGNVTADPTGEFSGLNVFFRAHSASETAERFAKTKNEINTLLADSLRMLLAARQARPRPHIDDKILTGWNGLAVSALAKGYRMLGDARYLAAARQTVNFIRENLFEETGGRLFRRWRENQRDINALAEDYAYLIQGLLDLYQADADPADLSWAIVLAENFDSDFRDKQSGGWFTTAQDHDRHLIIRAREIQDNVLPAAMSTAALNSLRLSKLTKDTQAIKNAEAAFGAAAPILKKHPTAAPFLLTAWGVYLQNNPAH